MQITAIRQTSPGRLTVCLEDGSEIKSSLGVVTDRRLYNGRELDEAELEALRLDSRRALARDRALELISRRPLSAKELRDKLLQKGEDEDAADYCVSWLTEHGFLNDESYAAAVARHYAAKG
ncbi:MAG: RecX family transcriptional regulator, partial [Oscillospiraceae bacterium]|nr:RecX family transcriptional regulator [Oscillospiraceae bacterium]